MERISESMKRFAACLALLSIATVSSVSAAAGEPVIMDEKRLEEFVKEVIRENPELLYETIDRYIQERRRRKADQDLRSAMENRIEVAAAGHNPAKGPDGAAITIFEFTDFECPYCRKGDKIVDTLLKRYPGKVRRVFKNKPLESHERAMPAAMAAMAAHAQGKFWEYHDRLFAEEGALDEATFVRLAEEMNLDMAKFNEDRASEKVAQWILEDMAEAVEFDITATPSFVINGVLIRGARPVKYFSNVIDQLLGE